MSSRAITSSDQLISRAKEIAESGHRPVVAVAVAQDADVIEAVAQANADGFLDAFLVGNADEIKKIADEERIAIGNLSVVDQRDINDAAHAAVKLAADGSADAVMKGFLPTSLLLKTVLDKKYNLRTGNTLSHCAVLDVPGYHKMLNITDGGVVVKPNTHQKYQILENALTVGMALGLSPIRVAVSAAVDRLSETMPHTLADLDTLIPLAREQFGDLQIQGPMSLDVALSKEAAEYHGVGGGVVGDADIYLVDSIEEGNLISKTLIHLASAVFCGVIVGAQVPVALVSRTDSVQNKKASLAITCVVADYYRRCGIRKRN